LLNLKRAGEGKGRRELGWDKIEDDTQFIFSYQAFSDGTITFLSMLLSVRVAFHPPSTNEESYNGKVWLSFLCHLWNWPTNT
jgi:hypothetical protein